MGVGFDARGRLQSGASAGFLAADQHRRRAVHDARRVAGVMDVVDLLDPVVLLQRHVVEPEVAVELERRLEAGERNGLTPRARILATAVSGADPTIMLTGPAPASRKALAKAGITAEDLDLVEINEAFAAVVLRFVRDMGLDMEKVNVNGGAIAMGHPLGATGGMILGTLVDELHRTGGKYGLATLCVGGGMGIATVVEAI
jgi:acetyl-CoA acetyltransferase